MEQVSRRRFFGYAGATVAAGATATTLGGCSNDDDTDVSFASASEVMPFRDVDHQIGVTAPLAAAGIVVALDLRADSKDELRETFVELSESIEQVMSGRAYESRPGGYPAYDTGILGPEPGPTGTSVIVAYGDSMFDGRYGLADRKPAELQRMPNFANDYLVRSERSHGDLALTIAADSHDAAVHAMRQILRETRGRFEPRWMREGFNDLIPDAGPGEAPVRNLLGFKDGTSNLAPSDDEVMNRQVWIQSDDDQPEWAVGGTYQAVRVIRMQAEFWDRTRLNEQEDIFGRHRDSGAPLGMASETDTPVFGDSLESHIARANPRTPGSERNLILRKGFNYVSGLDGNSQLDQGLIFMSFQRSIEDGFITVQRRLDGEVLEEYIRPIGGGFYFAPRAPVGDEFLGEALLS